eukprot:2139245-Rhodomonas_salina.2
MAAGIRLRAPYTILNNYSYGNAIAYALAMVSAVLTQRVVVPGLGSVDYVLDSLISFSLSLFSALPEVSFYACAMPRLVLTHHSIFASATPFLVLTYSSLSIGWYRHAVASTCYAVSGTEIEYAATRRGRSSLSTCSHS